MLLLAVIVVDIISAVTAVFADLSGVVLGLATISCLDFRSHCEVAAAAASATTAAPAPSAAKHTNQVKFHALLFLAVIVVDVIRAIAAVFADLARIVHRSTAILCLDFCPDSQIAATANATATAGDTYQVASDALLLLAIVVVDIISIVAAVFTDLAWIVLGLATIPRLDVCSRQERRTGLHNRRRAPPG